MREQLLHNKILLCFACVSGVLFCLLNAFGVDLLCGTRGCAIYHGFQFLGLSFYVYGALGFLLLGLTGMVRPLLRWYPLVLFGGLGIDVLFLAYQYLFWPCTSCLVVALLWGLPSAGFLLSREHTGLQLKPLFPVLFSVWLVLFVTVSLGAAREMVFTPWIMAGNPNASMQVYFAPGCPECRKEITRLLEQEDPNKVAFCPIARNSAERARIARLLPLLRGANAATIRTELPRLFQSEAQGLPGKLSLRDRLGLWGNRILLAQMGRETVPTIVSSWLPQDKIEQQVTPPAALPAYSYWDSAEVEASGCSTNPWEEVCGE